MKIILIYINSILVLLMISQLVSELTTYSDSYYNTDVQLVSDEVYDAKLEELRILDPNNPFLTKVGGKVEALSSRSKWEV